MNLEKAWIHDNISVMGLFFFLCPESDSIYCPVALTVNSAGWVASSSNNESGFTNSHHLIFFTSLGGIPSAMTTEGAGVLGTTSDVPALLRGDGNEGMDGTNSGSIGIDSQDARGTLAKGIQTQKLLSFGPVDLWVL